MRAFVAVVEEGGLSAAARRLHVSQSALSQTVRSLERQLGVRLLVRDHTGARPTEAGRTLLDEARTLLARHDAMIATITGLPDEHAGSLCIGVPLEFPVDLLPPVLAELSAAHPQVTVNVRHSPSTAQLAELLAGELHVALVRDRPTDPRLDSVLAVEEAMGVILPAACAEEVAEAGDVPPTHPFSGASPRPPEPAGIRLHRLAGMSWVGFPRSDAPAWYDQVTATLRTHGITAVKLASGEDHPVTPEVKLAAVGTGRAFALASPGWARPLPEGLAWHPLIGAPLVRRTWAVWRAESRSRELAALIAALDITAV
ncbi:LysR family transcriptional regulator [Acrocarpospora phusangensis]|uniref:LysR family transcriptional regulator n=2 Tax=Acrocarpospora phusangensis TaxID=1070424 RepID=A0A919QBJ3_9ACTN|nr:LysR family transcriptional regulator [Acrocarpospora phusangensis]